MIKRQRIFIVLTLVIIAIMALVYYTVAVPYMQSKEPVVETPETLEGESLGTSNRYYMYDNLERKDIKSIEVTNKHGVFTFVKDEDDSLVIKGYEDIIVDETTLSYLVTTCGSTLSKMKLMDNASEEKLAEYGLDNPQAHWIVTDNNGKEYKVYVGRELLTGGGYYCRFAGRNSVYVLDQTIAYAILNPIEAYVTPFVVFGVSTDDYYTVDNFTIIKDGEKFMSVGILPKEEQSNPKALVEPMLTYPAPYVPDQEKLYSIYMGFESFTGDKTYKLGVEIEDLEACGLDNPQYIVSYEYKDNEYYFLVGNKTEEGHYYVISNMYSDIITLVSEEKLSFLKDGMMDWISPYLFQYYITSVEELTVKTDNINVTFYLTHGTVEENGKTKETLRVITDSGLEITSEAAIQNFRQYYKTLLTIEAKEYLPDAVPATGEDMESFLTNIENRDLYFSFKNEKGKVTTYEFYKYTTRRSAAVVNGDYEFYVLSDLVQKIANDTERILKGETIDSYSKN